MQNKPEQDRNQEATVYLVSKNVRFLSEQPTLAATSICSMCSLASGKSR
jgi:hypothetical protein